MISFLFWNWAVLVTVPPFLSFKCNRKYINFKIINYLKLDIWQSYWNYPGDGRIKKASGWFEVGE